MHSTIRNMIRTTDDRYYDPWGAMMSHGFAIAEVLSAPDCDGDVPAELDYRHGQYHAYTLDELVEDEETGEHYWEAQYVDALRAGDVSVADLEHAVVVIGRHLDLLIHCGRDY